MPHPQLRELLARDYASFTEPAAPPRDIVSPATAAVCIVLKLNESDWRPPEFLIDARDFCISNRIPVGESAHPFMQQWLTPLGAYRLLGGVPMDALSGQLVDLTDVLGAGLRRLADQLRETPSRRHQFALLDAYLLRRAQDGPEPPPEVAWAWRRLMATGGKLPIHRLAAEVGWSHKHLITRFRQQVGLPPKAAARLVRFDAVWRRLANHPPARWDQVAVECGYADQALGLHPRSARDFVDAIVALRMLDRDDSGRYFNTAETDLFLDPQKASYMGGMLEMCNARLDGVWGSLTEALRTGEPQSEVKTGGDFFETLYADPEKLAQFAGAMSGLSTATGQAIAAKFPWRDYGSVIDIGCAEGAVPVAIATAHEHLTGGGFDLPPIEPIFNAYVARSDLADRLRFTAGNFFADPLPSADVLIMGHILHDWDLDKKLMLLDKAYTALPKGGALIVYEAIIDDDRRENAFGLLMSLNMLIEGRGFDYTGADCRGWMAGTGFSESYVEHLVGPDSMVVGIK